jgi:hypothetical protein
MNCHDRNPVTTSPTSQTMMTRAHGITPDREFADPRQRSDFQPQYYPRANRKDVPPADTMERNDRVLIQFAAAYYSLNCEYSRLLAVRKRKGSAERDRAERECLQAIETALRFRDELEDYYAPFGVIVEPIVKCGFTSDLKVSFGNVDASGRQRLDLYTISAHIPIPLPSGVNLRDVPVQIHGPWMDSE